MDNSPISVENLVESVGNLALNVDKSAPNVDSGLKNVDKYPFSVDKSVDIGTFWCISIGLQRQLVQGHRGTGQLARHAGEVSLTEWIFENSIGIRELDTLGLSGHCPGIPSAASTNDRQGQAMLFEVFNTRTSEVKLSTDDLVTADIRVWQENQGLTGVGYEPTWVIRGVLGTRTFFIEVEEQ